MPTPKIDLHLHSTASDGRLDPADVVRLAAERDVALLALTDHDTLRGVPAAQAAGRELGVGVLAGIEISGRYNGGQCHLLAWLPDPAPADFIDWTHRKERERDERAREMVERLRALGHPISWEELRASVKGNIGRPHIADALVKAGSVATPAEAFERLIGNDCPAYVPSGKIAPTEAVAIAAGAGALVALAHPQTLKLDDGGLDDFVAQLAEAGLGAVEAHRGDQSTEQSTAYRAVAQRLGLLVSPGSDFHRLGEDTRWLGRCGDPGIAPDDLEELLSRLPGARDALGR